MYLGTVSRLPYIFVDSIQPTGFSKVSSKANDLELELIVKSRNQIGDASDCTAVAKGRLIVSNWDQDTGPAHRSTASNTRVAQRQVQGDRLPMTEASQPVHCDP